jgi:hypothetical protein
MKRNATYLGHPLGTENRMRVALKEKMYEARRCIIDTIGEDDEEDILNEKETDQGRKEDCVGGLQVLEFACITNPSFRAHITRLNAARQEATTKMDLRTQELDEAEVGISKFIIGTLDRHIDMLTSTISDQRVKSKWLRFWCKQGFELKLLSRQIHEEPSTGGDDGTEDGSGPSGSGEVGQGSAGPSGSGEASQGSADKPAKRNRWARGE